MAIYISVIAATANNATILISGMNTYYTEKRISVYIDGSYEYRDTFTSDSGSSEYSYTIDNILNPSTTYDIYVEIQYYVPGLGWEYNGQSNTVTFTTDSGGGGSGPTYIVYESNGNIVVQIQNPARYFDSYFYLYDSSSSSYSIQESGRLEEQDIYSFSGLSSGTTYYVECEYGDADSSWNSYSLQNRDTGQIRTPITIGGGGGGNWSYDDSISPIAISTETTPYVSYSLNFNAQNGYLFTFYLDETGTVEFYSSNTFGGPLISYAGPVNNGYDSNDGQPYSYVYSNTGAFDYTINATRGGVYYLWVTSENNSIFKLNINFTPSVVTTPTYTASVINNNQIQFVVSNKGNYYLRYWVRLTSDPNDDTFDSWEEYGQLINDTTLIVPNLQYNTSYTVNVGYSQNQYSGAVTHIGAQVLQTGSQPITTWEEVYVGDVNMTNTNRSFNRNIASYKTYRYNIIFSTSGKTRIYCTGGSSSADPIAYFGTTNNGINQNNGVPVNSDAQWDDVVTGGVRDYNFDSGEIDVIAGVSYYLWVKGINNNHTPNLVIYINAPTTASGCVWIYTSDGWKKAIPYIYNGSQWKQAQAYIYNGSQWKECGQ